VDLVFEGNEIRGLEQNPETNSRWAQMARSGKVSHNASQSTKSPGRCGFPVLPERIRPNRIIRVRDKYRARRALLLRQSTSSPDFAGKMVQVVVNRKLVDIELS
jgi:hypothetical protein